MEYKYVKFRPWVGEKYHTVGIFGKKILVLGESHYCKEDKNRNPACIALGHCSYDCMPPCRKGDDIHIYRSGCRPEGSPRPFPWGLSSQEAER